MKQKMQLIGEAKKPLPAGAPVEAVKQRFAELGITDRPGALIMGAFDDLVPKQQQSGSVR